MTSITIIMDQTPRKPDGGLTVDSELANGSADYELEISMDADGYWHVDAAYGRTFGGKRLKLDHRTEIAVCAFFSGEYSAYVEKAVNDKMRRAA